MLLDLLSFPASPSAPVSDNTGIHQNKQLQITFRFNISGLNSDYSVFLSLRNQDIYYLSAICGTRVPSVAGVMTDLDPIHVGRHPETRGPSQRVQDVALTGIAEARLQLLHVGF